MTTLAEEIERVERERTGVPGDVHDALRAQLEEAKRTDDTIRVRFPLDGTLDEAFLRAMLARHGLDAFRERGKKRTTLMTHGPRTYLETVFLPILREARRIFYERMRSAAGYLLDGVLPRGMTACPSCLHPRTDDRHEHSVDATEEDAETDALAAAIPRALAEQPAAPAAPPAAPSLSTAASAAPPATATVSRNAPCPCGSGRKFKRCCGRAV